MSPARYDGLSLSFFNYFAGLSMRSQWGPEDLLNAQSVDYELSHYYVMYAEVAVASEREAHRAGTDAVGLH